MTEEKKSFMPEDPQQPEKNSMIDSETLLIAVKRREDGELVVIDNLKNCQSIKEAWLMKEMLMDACDQFVAYVKMAMAQERQKLKPNFMQGLRNGLHKKR